MLSVSTQLKGVRARILEKIRMALVPIPRLLQTIPIATGALAEKALQVKET
jgi:hypothetical protein